MFYYKIKDGMVTGKTTTKPRFEHVESEEDWPLDSSYVVNQEVGVFGDPIKTYSQELAILNAEKKAKEKDFADRISLIHSRNGSAEAPTVTAMRNAILTKIDSDYAASKAALRLKYFGA
tara:strand:- start:56715 stop:57071 length:357 start_codon:yes stop_codon:yes gene_type:complete